MSWKPKEFKKGMVSTVSDATGLTNDYGYKKSPVNLERSIWHEGRSRCWSAGTRSGPEGEEQRCQIHLIKQLGCVGKEPAWQLENWELRRISTRPAEMSGQSANPDKSVSKRHHIYITPILKSSCTIATISFPLSLLLPLSLPSFHIENKSKSLLTLSPTILQINLNSYTIWPSPIFATPLPTCFPLLTTVWAIELPFSCSNSSSFFSS